MSDLSRRNFLAASTAGVLGGTAALGFLGQPAYAGSHGGGDQPSYHDGMAHLFPGSVDGSGRYVLPDLPYAYDAVSDVIDEQTMRLHHTRHHQAYVNGLIAAEEALAAARQSGDFSLAEHHLKKCAFHGAGHYLHCVFWDSIGPDADGGGMGGNPEGTLAEVIARDFGSTDSMLAEFGAASRSVEGNGWGILGYVIPARKLVVLQAQNHQLLSPWAVIPILCNDVWEHAYYLKYQNDRGGYVSGFPKIINWKRVARRFEMLHG